MVQGNGLQKLQFLLNCPHLVSLILYNVKEVKYSLKTLCNLEKLEHLDISQTDRYHLGHDDEEFDQPTKYLEELVTSLPHLKSLDISGTNLAADYSIVGGRGDCSLNDIPGESRKKAYLVNLSQSHYGLTSYVFRVVLPNK